MKRGGLIFLGLMFLARMDFLFEGEVQAVKSENCLDQ